MLILTTITLTTAPQSLGGQLAIPGGGILLVNIGGLDLAKALPGPDDALITVRSNDGEGRSFFLLSGAGISLPTNLAAIFARAASSTTTLTIMQGAHG